MDLLWLIGFFIGIEFLGLTFSSQVAKLSNSKDLASRGTQYRFHYFVRDERGDYKTQEEAGEGGNARGSYAVEEPDGDLRIVQYTTDLGRGFKAHIKVDHGGKSPSTLQEIDIPAEEMRKLMEENRKRSTQDVPELKSSKSYVLGPPRKMSDIVMEQAAAIREIISKEIEAEEKREAEEKLRSKDVVNFSSEKKNGSSENGETGRTSKARKIDIEETVSSVDPGSRSSRNSQIVSKNFEASINAKKIATLNGDEQSPVVHVALNPKNADGGRTAGSEKSLQFKSNHVVTPNPALAGPLLGGPVRNFSFKNRIMFYKPAERKASRETQESNLRSDSKNATETSLGLGKNLNEDLLNKSNDNDQDQILLYSPYQPEKNEGDRKSRYIAVPYEVLRPYLTSVEKEGERSK